MCRDVPWMLATLIGHPCRQIQMDVASKVYEHFQIPKLVASRTYITDLWSLGTCVNRYTLLWSTKEILHSPWLDQPPKFGTHAFCLKCAFLSSFCWTHLTPYAWDRRWNVCTYVCEMFLTLSKSYCLYKCLWNLQL